MRNIVIFGLFFFLSACGQYEEGPDISFRSKMNRISNTWKIEKAYKDNEDITNNYNFWRLTLTKEGYFFFFYTLDNSSFNINFTGNWELSNDKDKIIVYIRENLESTIIQEYKILKLKENEMWLYRLDDQEEWHLVPA